jgi:hypothetical protein
MAQDESELNIRPNALRQMLRRSISVILAALLIVGAVAIFVLMPDRVAVAAAALVAGVIWLYGELSDDLWRPVSHKDGAEGDLR